MENQKAVAMAGSELDRLFNGIEKQYELISVLNERLHNVSHRSPTEASDSPPSQPGHINSANEGISLNNRRLQTLIEELAI